MTPAMLRLKGWKRVGDDLHERWLAPGIENGEGVPLDEAVAVQVMKDERARRRDEFAKAAMMGLVASPALHDLTDKMVARENKTAMQIVAPAAVAYADALLVALDDKESK